MRFSADLGESPSAPLAWRVVAPLVVLIVLLIPGEAVASDIAAPVRPVRPRCSSVHFVINPAQAPSGAVATVREAIHRVSEASGIKFTFDGETTAAPGPAWDVPGRFNRPLLVAWTDAVDPAADRSALAWTTASWDAPTETLRTGSIFLNDRVSLPVGFDDRYSWGGVLMHELGHLVGVPHAAYQTEMMYSGIVHGPAEWGPIDLYRLREAGGRFGCSPAG